ncbi:hypothetical protein ANANG_G00018990 [Anguilla anguilla]|uniref:Centrosomal protein kizuna n=1 Tax=Anguilla anguilla TaxID=7936 RepID=A0A9D3N206_ANGAN|nr:hypothetical protein ANANG_G00018990 [Anguilla anguilla]
MAFCDKEYFEKIGELQQNMHKSEKRRFQLERELLAICTSGKQGSEMKNTKLRCYLKQICERENRAKARNLELLRNMEIIEFNMKALCSNHSALRQKKPPRESPCSKINFLSSGCCHASCSVTFCKKYGDPAMNAVFMGEGVCAVQLRNEF